MPTFGQQFLQGFTGTSSLRDYTHASKAFTTNSFELKPRYKFLFHVSFTLNSDIPAISKVIGTQEAQNLSVVVKTVDLPKYSIATETLNQYNRKRVVQTKINYEPVTLTFHDDSGDNVRNMWYNYYSYYYKDANQQYLSPSNQNGSIGQVANQPGFTYNSRDIYANNRPVNDWGYIGEGYSQGYAGGPSTGSGGDQTSGKPPFFSDITIYGMDQHKWVSYVLINPLVKEWKHDQYNYSEGGGVMENSMTVEYETVKYYSGAIGGSRPDTNIKGFADPAHYDNIRSSLARPGSTRSVLGQGGLLDAGIGIVQDLQSGNLTGAIGAVQKAGTAYNTFKGANIRSVVNEEANSAVKSVIRNSLPGAIRNQQNGSGGFVFPRSPGR